MMMNRHSNASRLGSMLVGVFAALSLVACGDNVKVVGSVDESIASDGQGLTASGATGAAASFEGSLVVAYETDEKDPSVQHEIATAKVQADGTYSLSIPRGSTRVTVKVFSDASAKVMIAAGLLDSADGDSERHMAPLNRESTLEALVFAEMAATVSIEGINTIDLRARIDAEMAAEYFGLAGAELERARVGLAAAVRAAQDARIKAYAKAGVNYTQVQLFQASLSAAAQVDAKLSAGVSADTAWTGYWTSIEAELQISAEAMNEGERASSASFRLTIEARVDAGAFRTAAIRAAALVEAHVAHIATKAILVAGSASEAAIAAATAAGERLLADLRAAHTDAAIAGAFASWKVTVSGQGEGSVLRTFVQVGGSSVSLELVIAAANTANAALELALTTAANLLEALNIDGFTSAVVTAIAEHRTHVRNALESLVASLGDRRPFAISLVVVANGSFTMG